MNKKELLSLIKTYSELYPTDIHAQKTIEFIQNHDQFWQRDNEYGHITASAWVLNQNRDKALLTHHHKLDIWVQLGGHIEEIDKDIYDACQRELEEESGLKDFKLLSREILDIDVHKIPISKAGFPEHFHFDIRLIFEANSNESINFDLKESKEVTWILLAEIEHYTQEWSVRRMVEKSRTYQIKDK